MGNQTVRQQARARAREARAKAREEQARRERRLSKSGERVAVALAERDAVVAEYERRAGWALRSMVEDEGLSTRAALAWCGDDGLTAREAQRLIRAAAADDHGDGGVDSGQDAQVSPGQAN